MTTSEEKFFGVMSPVSSAKEAPGARQEGDDELEIEIVDDTPRKPAKAGAAPAASHDDDDELAGYSEKVKKRIAKLKWQQGEAERKAEAAERMREEALTYAQRLMAENQQYQSLVQRGEGALIGQIKTRAQLQLETAKAKYREAYEAGDTDKIIAAQEDLLTAQTELREAEKHERAIQSRTKTQPAGQPPAPQAPQPTAQPGNTPPAPSQKALQWAERNPWFGAKGDKEMTALAYGIHERLIRDEGIQPDTDEYYEAIDEAMRTRFPERFEQEPQTRQTPQARQPSSVVAAPKRSTGAGPRRIALTATQVALAKRLGLTPEQYAKQLMKEANNG